MCLHKAKHSFVFLLCISVLRFGVRVNVSCLSKLLSPVLLFSCCAIRFPRALSVTVEQCPFTPQF